MQSVDLEDHPLREDHEELGGIEEEDEGRKESQSSGSQLDCHSDRNKLTSASDADGGRFW